jgi:hypothetical protein
MASKALMDKDENRGCMIARIEERRDYSVVRGLSDKNRGLSDKNRGLSGRNRFIGQKQGLSDKNRFLGLII